jgi:hypothetical protein
MVPIASCRTRTSWSLACSFSAAVFLKLVLEGLHQLVDLPKLVRLTNLVVFLDEAFEGDRGVVLYLVVLALGFILVPLIGLRIRGGIRVVLIV